MVKVWTMVSKSWYILMENKDSLWFVSMRVFSMSYVLVGLVCLL